MTLVLGVLLCIAVVIIGLLWRTLVAIEKDPQEAMIVAHGWRACDSCNHIFPPGRLHEVMSMQLCDGCFASTMALDMLRQAVGENNFNRLFSTIMEHSREMCGGGDVWYVEEGVEGDD